MTYPKRLIEVDLPIKRSSVHARREKSIRHGHISTLHIWWARRPLAACRAVICAALWPDPADPLCPQAFREKATNLIIAFALKATAHGKLANSCSQESMACWLTLAKPGNRLDPTNPAHLNVLRFALLDFIADFANWDNSTVKEYLETARLLTQIAHLSLSDFGFAIADLRLDPWSDKFREQIENLKSTLENLPRPLVVDPFAGGGSIPLEALRVGADAFASDLNPVAVLLNKVVLEYIPKYGQRLADEVRKWGEWIKREAERELSRFYPSESDGNRPVAYIWARTILSEAPGEEEIPIEVPLFRSMWLSNKPSRRWAFRWVKDAKERVKTETVKVTYADGVERTVRRPLLEVFHPKSASEVEKGTSQGGAATCSVSGYTNSVERVREQLKIRYGGAADARLLCVVTTPKNASGRVYRLPSQTDLQAAAEAKGELSERQANHSDPLPLLPKGKLNHLRGFFNVVLYG